MARGAPFPAGLPGSSWRMVNPLFYLLDFPNPLRYLSASLKRAFPAS